MRILNLTRSTELASSARPARSFWLRLVGLLGRSSLEPGEGKDEDRDEHGGSCKKWNRNWHLNYTSIASIRRIIMIPTASRTTAAPSSIFPKLSVKRTPM